MSSTVLSIRDTGINKTDKISTLIKLRFQEEKGNNI